MEDTSVSEPVCKKAKMEDAIAGIMDNILTSTNALQAVLSDDFLESIPLIEVYVAEVKCIQELSKIILILNQKIPLKKLSHLKRARKKQILLFPADYINNNTDNASVQYYIEENANELKDSFECFKIISVPAVAPRLKHQYNACSQFWPCNFHPNKYFEKIYNGQIFSEEEIKHHRLYMSMAFEVTKFYKSYNKEDLNVSDVFTADFNAAIVVDPRNKSVVAVAFDNREHHPIQHSAMLAIDNVAKTQNGGAWDADIDNDSVNLKGIGCMDLLLHLKKKYPTVTFGAKNYVSKNSLDEQNLSASECPYLCTGYYIYLIREPCLMCSMGLVHARINKVFFYKRHSMGALGSKTKLHCVPSLNHHFEVYAPF